ncbi:(2Fe-2S)-binding protein [Sphingomicrobium sediminis]|uniref:Bacterioferritin-associated ferredoxin n=1 Tax=Sphingomicrobium sediminis TaxID=2950949 RepID=A0A9X2EGH2_9SPHN|nr:(2Fe-2S)-binding protein [Sphingomicrobium sediminis]MCM8557583.1 (2Fe-2S)-binding protein [Sphingomicrobium sediminis]
MIVCSCNVIREKDIRDAARRGCPDAETAYRSLGCQFQCGGCEDHADDLVACERAKLLAPRDVRAA